MSKYAPLTEEWLQELRDDATRLIGLLDDPHPGLHMWCLMLGGVLQNISEKKGT